MGKQAYYKDEDLSLYLLGSSNPDGGGRYYDPESGPFLSKDPTGFAAGDANLYRYVKNNPINVIDPSGHDAFAGKPILTHQWKHTTGSVIRSTKDVNFQYRVNPRPSGSTKLYLAWSGTNACWGASAVKGMLDLRWSGWPVTKENVQNSSIVHRTKVGGGDIKDLAVPFDSFWKTITKSGKEGGGADLKLNLNQGVSYDDPVRKANYAALDAWWAAANGLEPYKAPNQDGIGLFFAQGATTLACGILKAVDGRDVCGLLEKLKTCGAFEQLDAFIATLYNRGSEILKILLGGAQKAFAPYEAPEEMAGLLVDALLKTLKLGDFSVADFTKLADSFAGGDFAAALSQVGDLLFKFFGIDVSSWLQLDPAVQETLYGLMESLGPNGDAGGLIESLFDEAGDLETLADDLATKLQEQLKEMLEKLLVQGRDAVIDKVKKLVPGAGTALAVIGAAIDLIETLADVCDQIKEFLVKMTDAMVKAAESPAGAEATVAAVIQEGLKEAVLPAAFRFLLNWAKLGDLPNDISEKRTSVKALIGQTVDKLKAKVAGSTSGLPANATKAKYPPVKVPDTDDHLWIGVDGKLHLASEDKTLQAWIDGCKTSEPLTRTELIDLRRAADLLERNVPTGNQKTTAANLKKIGAQVRSVGEMHAINSLLRCVACGQAGNPQAEDLCAGNKCKDEQLPSDAQLREDVEAIHSQFLTGQSGRPDTGEQGRRTTAVAVLCNKATNQRQKVYAVSSNKNSDLVQLEAASRGYARVSGVALTDVDQTHAEQILLNYAERAATLAADVVTLVAPSRDACGTKPGQQDCRGRIAKTPGGKLVE